jgi:hypothetical protein
MPAGTVFFACTSLVATIAAIQARGALQNQSKVFTARDSAYRSALAMDSVAIANLESHAGRQLHEMLRLYNELDQAHLEKFEAEVRADRAEHADGADERCSPFFAMAFVKGKHPRTARDSNAAWNAALAQCQ